MTFAALRLEPGQDFRGALEQWARQQQIKAAAIVSGIGSLTQASIRLANDKEPRLLQEYFEICTVQGMVSQDGVHVHYSIADKSGVVLGGHLSAGSLVFTTIELALILGDELHLRRVFDVRTNSPELMVETSLNR